MTDLPRLKTFAERLAWARERSGLTQDELSTRSGVSRDSIAKSELGKTKRPKGMKQLADTLDVPSAWLAFGEEKLDEWDEDTFKLADAIHKMPPALRAAWSAIVFATVQPDNPNHLT